MNVPFTRRDEISWRAPFPFALARPLPVRPERIGGSAATDDDVEGSAATDDDVEGRRHLRSPAPSAPFFDVSLPPSSVGFAQNERNTWFRGLGAVISQQAR